MLKFLNFLHVYLLLYRLKDRSHFHEADVENIVELIKRNQYDWITELLFEKYFDIFNKNSFINNPNLNKYFYYNLEYLNGVKISEKYRIKTMSLIIETYRKMIDQQPGEKDLFFTKMFELLIYFNFNFKNDFDYQYLGQSLSQYFWKHTLKFHWKELNSISSVLDYLYRLEFDFNSMYDNLDSVVCSNLINQVPLDVLRNDYGFYLPKFISSGLKINMIDEIENANQNFYPWIELVRSVPGETELDSNYLIKLYNKDLSYKSKLLNDNPDNFLNSLIVNDYKIIYFKESVHNLERLKKISDIKEFLKETLGRDGKRLTSLFLNKTGRTFNISFFDFFDVCKKIDVNHVYAVIEKLDTNAHFYLDSLEKIWFTNLLEKISDRKKVSFLIEAFENVKLAKSVCSFLSKVKIEDLNFKEINSLSKLDLALQLQYQKEDSKKDLDLNQEGKYPVLKKLQGYKIRDLKFQVPNHSNQIWFYSIKMNNCIYRDYLMKCFNNNSILIGVYKNDELTYNIEVGIDYTDTSDIEYMMQSYDSKPLFKQMKKLQILHIEKRNKALVPELDKMLITQVLRDISLIS